MDLEEVVRRLRRAGCVFAEDEARLLTAEHPDPIALVEALRRREAGEPLEQILGWAEFAGLRIGVTPGVFVPRLRTTAVLRAVDALRRPLPPLRENAHGVVAPPEPLPEAGALLLDGSRGTGAVVLDLCCGTGALGAALLAAVPGIEVVATDIDPVAVACARLNLPGSRVVEGDLFDAVPTTLAGRIALVVVNAPYVPTAEIANLPTEARMHEHPTALDGGSDGLDLHRRIADTAAGWVRPGGALVLETSGAQAESSAALFPAALWSTAVVRDEEVDGTVVVARRRPDHAVERRR